MNEDRPVLHWLRRKWRALCSARKAAQERNPGGLLRLAVEVRIAAERLPHELEYTLSYRRAD